MLSRHHPIHVTVRTVREVGRLRRRDCYRAVRRALVTVLRRDDFRICQLSIQQNHIHLIVEADHAMALARGMQGFQISCARLINRALARRGFPRRGQVFADRYHASQLGSPRRARNALAYVLNNWRRHREDRLDRGDRSTLDPFATGAGFDGWTTPRMTRLRPDSEILPVSFPRSWLLTTGWKRHSRIDPGEIPGPRKG